MIKYKATVRKNPVDKSLKYYPAPASPEPRMLDQLTDEIEQKCTLTRVDIMACLTALQESIVSHLKDGRSVRFGELGSFRVSLTGKGCESADEVKTDSIQRIRVLFRPSAQITKSIRIGAKGISFQRIGSQADEATDEGSGASA